MIQQEIEQLQEKLQKKLTTKRYYHTVGVRYTACSMAMRYQVDCNDASIAGVLHDCAKCMTDEALLKECKKNQISCSTTEINSPYLLHAKLGACYAQKKYGISNPEILSAIRYHTTGRPGMTELEKIIFIADYIEPHRKPLPDLPAIRREAFCDLDEAMYLILKSTLDYLEETANTGSKQKEIDQHTVDAYEYYKQIHDTRRKQ